MSDSTFFVRVFVCYLGTKIMVFNGNFQIIPMNLIEINRKRWKLTEFYKKNWRSVSLTT